MTFRFARVTLVLVAVLAGGPVLHAATAWSDGGASAITAARTPAVSALARPNVTPLSRHDRSPAGALLPAGIHSPGALLTIAASDDVTRIPRSLRFTASSPRSPPLAIA